MSIFCSNKIDIHIWEIQWEKQLLSLSSLVACCLLALYPLGLQAAKSQQSGFGEQNQDTLFITAIGETKLKNINQIAFATDGFISTIAVDVGDPVNAGDLLIELDVPKLELAARQAALDVESAKATLLQLQEAATESDIEMARANLLSAQEQMVLTEAGPTTEELQAASSRAMAALSEYNELITNAATPAVNVAYAQWQKSAVDLQQAQRAYDKVKWLPEVGMTEEAAQLQRVTLEHDAAQANYEQVSQFPLDSKIASALAASQQAQHDLNLLQQKPTTS